MSSKVGTALPQVMSQPASRFASEQLPYLKVLSALSQTVVLKVDYSFILHAFTIIRARRKFYLSS